MIDINLGFTRIVGAEMFQSVNPLFVVVLTPLIVALFSWLNRKGKEPSTPKKIAIGMGIAAAAYLIMTFASMNLPLFSDVEQRRSGAIANWSFYTSNQLLCADCCELFISRGTSFVSKVAPPYAGIVQGGGWCYGLETSCFL
jgi:POT family proton-dependent oligopeptide transporter